MPKHPPKAGPTISKMPPYALTFCVGAATLGLQLVQTRIYSVVYWNHLVYFVISIALLGFGISGTWLAIGQNTRFGRFLTTGRAAIGFSASALIACLAAPQVNTSLAVLLDDVVTGGFMLITYATGVLPYFFAGWILGIVYRDYARFAGGLYMWDLAGAATGCFAFLGLMRPLGAVGFLVACTVIVHVPFLIRVSRSRALRVTAVAVFAAVFGVWLRGPLERSISPEPTKALVNSYADLDADDARVIEFSEWNAISRIDVGSTRKEPGLKRVFIDGDAWTGVATPRRVQNISGGSLDLVRLPMLTMDDIDRALVIGSGGGMDVRRLMQFDPNAIDCVEINPTTARIMQAEYAKAAEGLFARDGITLYAEDGRSFARRSTATYDCIVMSSVDTFAAISTGAYVLSENYLYTVEAFEDYLARLSPDGLLIVSRWSTEPELARLFAVALEALYRADIPNPAECITVISVNNWFAMYVKKRPFTAEEIAAYDEIVAESNLRGVDRLHPPADDGPPRASAHVIREYANARAEGNHDVFLAELPYKIDPVYDDNPFFFHYDRFRNLFRVRNETDSPMELIRGHWASFTLTSLLTFLTIAVLTFMIIPLLKHDSQSVRRQPGWIVYFAALGLSFICVEIALMQRFALLLGHPARSLALVLAALLLSAGIGSGLGTRLRLRPPVIFAGVIAAILAAAYVYPSLAQRALGFPLPVRGAVTVVLVAPVGFFLGMPFPWAIRQLQNATGLTIPWMWGINGGATVLGSVFAIVIAMTTNFTTVFLIAAIGYAVAAVIALTRSNVHVPPQPKT